MTVQKWPKLTEKNVTKALQKRYKSVTKASHNTYHVINVTEYVSRDIK